LEETSRGLSDSERRSRGRNLSQKAPVSAADLNNGETIDSLHAARGLVKDSTFAIHPSGSKFNDNSPASSFSLAIFSQVFSLFFY
jgi:hypothetical protein